MTHIFRSFRSYHFAAGFACSLFFFVQVNFDNYTKALKGGLGACDHCLVSFGFPFTLGEYGGYVGIVSIIWSGVIVNALIAMAVSVIAGSVVKRLFTSRIDFHLD